MDAQEKKALNPTVKKLGAVSFFADVASEMLYPITPIFLTSVLGASMASLGLIEGVAEAIASLLKTYSGSLSDRIAKRKPFMVLGYFLGAISKPFIGASTSWVHVLLARGLDRTGKGLRSAPRDALIADAVAPENRGAAFGWHRGMDTLGAAVGPLLTVTLISTSASELRQLYLWALIPGLISVVLAMSVQEVRSQSMDHAPDKKDKILKAQSTWSFADFSFSFKSYLGTWMLFSLTNSSDVFLVMKAKSSGLSTIHTVLLYCAFNLTYALSSPYLGWLSDRISRKKLMASGLMIYFLVYVGFGFSSEVWHYWVLFLAYGFYMGATEGIGKALAVDLCPQNLKATALGLLGTVTGLATIIASTLAGLIWDHYGAAFTFFYGAFGALIAFMLLIGLPLKKIEL